MGCSAARITGFFVCMLASAASYADSTLTREQAGVDWYYPWKTIHIDMSLEAVKAKFSEVGITGKKRGAEVTVYEYRLPDTYPSSVAVTERNGVIDELMFGISLPSAERKTLGDSLFSLVDPRHPGSRCNKNVATPTCNDIVGIHAQSVTSFTATFSRRPGTPHTVRYNVKRRKTQ